MSRYFPWELTPTDNFRSGPFLIGSLVFLAVSLFMSGSELLYRTRGQTATATITGIEEHREHYRNHNGYTRHRTKHAYKVAYTDANGGKKYADFSASYSHHRVGDVVTVQMVPGVLGMIRFAEQSGPLPFMMLAGSLMGVIGSAIWMGVEFHRPYGNSREDRDQPVVARSVGRKKKRVLKPLKPIDDE